jgi:hypothetical protein
VKCAHYLDAFVFSDCYCVPLNVFDIVLGQSTIIESPGFASSFGYCNHLNCAWQTNAPIGYSLQINLTFIEIRDNLLHDDNLLTISDQFGRVLAK